MDPDASIQQGLDALAARLGHSLSLDDPQGRLIAYSVQDAGADPARIAAILSRQVAPAIQDWQNRHGIAEATGPVPVAANPELGMTARLCVPIRRGRRCLGYLWVLEAGTPLDEAAIGVLTRFGHELARSLSSAAPRQDVDGLVRGLLGAEPGALDKLTAALPTLLDFRALVCAFVPAVKGREAVAPLNGIAFARLSDDLPAVLRRYPDYVGSFVGATHAVALLRHGTASKILADLDGFVDDPFTIGISEPSAFEVRAIREAHGQALAAAELAALDPALPNPIRWKELGPYRTLLGARPPADDLLAPLDKARTLAHTLETYLDLGGDARRTAERLHLHRTTLYYRLGRITELLDVDLGDGLARLDLHLALKGRRVARRTLS